MRAISFFAAKNHLGCQIRGRQIANRMGWKYNPKSGYEDDVWIHIKPPTLDRVRDGDWVDISDGYWLPMLLVERPKVNAIVHSRYLYETLRLPNRIAYIPQQHVNWERAMRTRTEVTTCGYIGAPKPEAMRINAELGAELNKAGWEFIFCHDYRCREDACHFYQSIDVLVIAPWAGNDNFKVYKTPAKMINAAAFGIPAIADPVPGYLEFEGSYLHASDYPALIQELERFRDPAYYAEFADKALRVAENYHIDRIGDLYRRLI